MNFFKNRKTALLVVLFSNYYLQEYTSTTAAYTLHKHSSLLGTHKMELPCIYCLSTPVQLIPVKLFQIQLRLKAEVSCYDTRDELTKPISIFATNKLTDFILEEKN